MGRKNQTVFISYRRDDGAGYAGRLYDNLCARYGSKRIFMDIDSIAPGQDFARVLQEAVTKSTVLLVVIGKRWAGVGANGRPRILDPNDFVRLEIAAALRRPNLRIVPILIQGASIPSAESLPEDIRDLTRRNGFELSDFRWKEDVAQLTNEIERPVPVVPATPEAPSTDLALSETARVVNTIISPARTFTDLRRNSGWWGPFVLLAVVSTTWVFVVSNRIGFQKVVENQRREAPNAARGFESMTPEERDRMVASTTDVTRALAYYGGPIFLLINSVIIAAFLLATINFVFRADLKFKVVLALVMYATLPNLLKWLLSIEVVLGANADTFSMNNPAATNPGYFLDRAAHPALGNLLTSLDVFTIWSLILTAIGITCISKLKRGTAFAVVFGWFAVAVLVRVALAAAFS